MQDCSDVMQLLLKTQTDWQDLPEDDPQVSQKCLSQTLSPVYVCLAVCTTSYN